MQSNRNNNNNMNNNNVTPSSIIRSMESNHKPLVILRCKVVIVGDACVGKTALTQVFYSGGATYPKNYLMTIGAEFCVKQIPFPETNYIVELYINDCAGQSICNQMEMNAKYYEDAAAVMVVSSISSRESLQSASKWLSSVKSVLSPSSTPITVLVCNKNDLRDGTIDSRAEITSSDGKSIASGLGAAFFETSAALNNGVEAPFKHIAEEFMRRYEESAPAGADEYMRR